MSMIKANTAATFLPGTCSICPLYISYVPCASPLRVDRHLLTISTRITGRSSSSSSTRITVGPPSSSRFPAPLTVRSWNPPSGSSSGSGLPSVSRRGLMVGGVARTGVPWIAAAAGAVMVAAALALTAMAGEGGPQQRAILATRQGMQLFTKGNVNGSLEKFDEALELDPQQLPCAVFTKLAWFEEAAKQFRDDVAVNPNDTEESIWCFMCEAQLYGVDEARRRFLVVGQDRRPIMAKIYDLFRFGGSTDKILQAVNGVEGHDFFYASLYAGLYHEAHKEQDAAKEAILAAVRSPYGTRSGDYMATLAKVHAQCRGWKVSSASNI